MRFGRADYDAAIIDTSGNIPDDEPCLLIRSQDSLGPEMAREYAHKQTVRGNPEIAHSAYEQARRMDAYQRTKMPVPKTADLPDAAPSPPRTGSPHRQLPTRIRLVGDAKNPGACKILDADTSQPVKFPVKGITFHARIGGHNACIVELCDVAFEGEGEPRWVVGEEDLQLLAAHNGYRLVKADEAE